MFETTRHRIRPNIQMAPLIDMMFLLLIFFMVTTIFPEDMGIEIEKPLADTGAQMANGALEFTVSAKGEYYHSGEKITFDKAMEIIRESKSGGHERPVIIRIDRKAAAGLMVKFIDGSRLAGATSISIATITDDER